MWHPVVTKKVRCSKLSELRTFSHESLPLQVSCMPEYVRGTWDSDPIGALLSGFPIDRVLLVETWANPRHAFVFDGINGLVWDDLEPHPLRVCEDVLVRITGKRIGEKNRRVEYIHMCIVEKRVVERTGEAGSSSGRGKRGCDCVL